MALGQISWAASSKVDQKEAKKKKKHVAEGVRFNRAPHPGELGKNQINFI